DRDFLDRTVTITLGLDGTGRVDVVAGGYEDWQRKRLQTIASKARADKPGGKAPSTPPPPPPARPAKLSYKDQRDLELLPARIEELEAAIAKGEAILSDPTLYTADPQRFANISQGIENARAEKDAAEERWLELAEQAGA
ncbi:MAG TPA: elongation factor 3, partial [Erythrobacter sp.]|nr:elongation factor 3 [Erythrobacter sp.]